MTELTSEQLRRILTYDQITGFFTWVVPRRGMKSGQPAGRINHDGYVQVQIGGRRYLGHRLAWLYVTGEWPASALDHKNALRSDNSWTNLRMATGSQNKANSRRQTNNTSDFKGVSFNKSLGKWQAQIGVGGSVRYLGLYDTGEAAHAAYVAAANAQYGSFSRAL